MTPNNKNKMSNPFPFPFRRIRPLDEIFNVKSFVLPPMSVGQYDRDLNHAIDASLGLMFLSDDDLLVLDSEPQKNPEKGESSNSANPFLCEICTESKQSSDFFCITGCSHSYCVDCVVMYVTSKLQENVVEIHCPVPGCVGSLELETCRDILPKEVFDGWGFALCEAMIGVIERFYCPFKDCSALMINDGGEAGIRESECPNCHRLFCAQCKVAWHSGIEC